MKILMFLTMILTTSNSYANYQWICEDESATDGSALSIESDASGDHEFNYFKSTQSRQTWIWNVEDTRRGGKPFYWGYGQSQDLFVTAHMSAATSPTTASVKVVEGQKVSLTDMACYQPKRTKITCKADRPESDGNRGDISFTVEALDSDRWLDQYWPADMSDEDGCPYTFENQNSYFKTYEYGCGDGGIGRDEGKLVLSADQDGVEYGDLVLYKNSGYKKGYFKFTSKADPETFEYYTTVSCDVTVVE